MENYRCVQQFVKNNFKHFNAAVVVDAAEAWINLLSNDGKMLLAMAGAMSTAEIGITLAEMIRQNKIHAISCTGANIEEDIFNLVAHSKYKRIANYRDLSPADEKKLFDEGMNRVTDTCIPENEAMKRIQNRMIKLWTDAEQKNERYFPYEFFYKLIRSGELKQYYEIEPKNSWLLAACEKNVPIFVPGWEDSTLGNVFVAQKIKGKLSTYNCIKNGLELMEFLVQWYKENRSGPIGFFQIGGGISGDFAICVAPLITQDLNEKCKVWSYFCQISDSTTSYGSYSGAVPNEKITWGKLEVDTPSFMIESDATIVVPLVFAYVLAGINARN